MYPLETEPKQSYVFEESRLAKMEEDKAAEASTWLTSDTVIWIGGALAVAVTVGGVVWLISRPNRKGRQRRQKTKKEMWRSEKMPTEHLRFLYSALGSNPLDCEVLRLFCDSYGGRSVPFFFVD